MASSAPQRPLRWRRFALAGGAVASALLVCELALRLWGAFQDAPGPAQFLVHDAELGWRNRPGFAGRHVTAEFAVPVRFDAEGARCSTAPDAPAGAAAASAAPAVVLAIGDSTTFGWGVAYEECFAARLADQLQVAVRNFGVNGYGSDQQLLLLEQLLARHSPRLVVVTHQENDVAEVLQGWTYGRYKPQFASDDGELRRFGAPVPRSWPGELSHLWRTLQKHLGAYETPGLDDAAIAQGRTLVRRLYGAMQRVCAARGAAFLLVVPGADWLVQAAAADGLACCDLSPTLAGLQRAGPLSFANDPHWLPRVHAAVAEVLAGRIRAAGWLAEPAQPRER